MSLFYTNETNTLKNHQEKVGDIMTFLKPINRRVGSLFAVAALVLATVTPGLVPAFASAAQVTERSVALSSSSRGAGDVTYTVEFTPATAGGAATLLEFCTNTPLIGEDCVAPAGFSLAAAEVGVTPLVDTTAAEVNRGIVVDTLTQSTPKVIAIDGVQNPTGAGTVFVRIVTYTSSAAAQAYTSVAPGSGTVDQGSAAISITDTIGVSGAVLESMTFCVAGNTITGSGCTRSDASPLTAPTLRLGETVGNVTALSSGAVSEGSIYTQLSTNAVSGAVVNLKSSAINCGGLLLNGNTANDCDIAPAGAGGITLGEAKFGAKVAAATDPTGATSGNLRAFGNSTFYNSSVFKLNYVALNASGVTGPVGDPFLDTADAPVSNKNAQITFGASVSNNTPAGLYSADLSLIATGKF